MATYVQFEKIKASVPEWETYAGSTAGALWDLEETHDTFFNIVFRAVGASEGVTRYLYRDIKGHVTVGIGFLIAKVNSSTGELTTDPKWLDDAKKRIRKLQWSIGENGTLLTEDEVWEELKLFISATTKYKDLSKPWNVKASNYEQYSNLRMNGSPEAVFRMMADALGVMKAVEKAFPQWKELPIFSVTSAFYLAWARGTVTYNTDAKDAEGDDLVLETLNQSRYRDYEEESVTSVAKSNLKGNTEGGTAYVMRDLSRATAKYWCKSTCMGQCSRASQCSFKDQPTPEAAPPPTPTAPASDLEPHQPEPQPDAKYDEWVLELRIWDPWVRSYGYSGSATEWLFGSTQYSMRGDGHTDFGELTEAEADAAHRVLLTAAFRYYYEEVDGQKVGLGISAKTGLDPALESGLHTATIQKLPIFGPTVRYSSEDGTEWKVDDSEEIPPNDPEGATVCWAADGADLFQSFSIKVAAENPCHPYADPTTECTLTVQFKDNFLKLLLAGENYPSLGIRLRRTRSGSTEEMLPDWKVPVVDAYANYQNYLASSSLTLTPAVPSSPKEPGPAQMDSKLFKFGQANEGASWSKDLDWTASPEPPAATAPASEAPPPPPAQTYSNLRDMYLATDQSQLYDLLVKVWEKVQVDQLAPAYKPHGRKLATGPFEIDILAVRSLQTFGDYGSSNPYRSDNVSLEILAPTDDTSTRTAWNDTMFLLWLDASGGKHVQAIACSTEPSCTTGSGDSGTGVVSWLADPIQTPYVVGSHNNKKTWVDLDDMIAQLRDGSYKSCRYRCLCPGEVAPAQWFGRPDASAPGGLRCDRSVVNNGSSSVQIHYGSRSSTVKLTTYSGGSLSLGCQIIYHPDGYEKLWQTLELDGSIKGWCKTTYLTDSPPTFTENRELTYTLINSQYLKTVMDAG